MQKPLPEIPAKRYFTIGEVSELCAVKPYVLRYWEQEFTQLRPMKRRGNRRYYQHHEVLLIRRIRDLLYEQGFTISGARNRLSEGEDPTLQPLPDPVLPLPEVTESALSLDEALAVESTEHPVSAPDLVQVADVATKELSLPVLPPVGRSVREELELIRALLEVDF